MSSRPLFRSLLAASLCFAPLGWAAAQDQPQDPQHPRDHQEQHQQDQHQQQQQHGQPQQQQHTQQPQGNAAPQGQHTGGGGQAGGGHPGGGGQQHPAQNAAPSTPPVQHQTQAAPTPPSPPAGATAAPTPPNQARFQGQPQHNNAAPAAPAAATPQPQQQQQQFQQQHAGQRGGGAPGGSAAPQAQSQQRSQPQQNNAARGNFQGTARANNNATFSQHHYGAAPVQFDHGHFYGRDYAHFTSYDRDLWGRGAWHHETRDGRFGWWYAVDGIWYFYAQPVYPYPTYVPDVVYFPEDDAPPVYVDAPPPAPAPPQYGQPPAYYYYFCPDSQTYYPYVNSCASSWQPVPATPAPPQ